MELREVLRAAGQGIVFVASLVLLGCGGGEDRVTTLSSDGPAFVEGTAMLGTVTGATVTAVELNANGAELHTLVTTSTDGQGSYHFLLGPGYEGGPILLKLRGGGGATALCDVAGGCGDGYEWGAAVPLASSVEMRALLPPATSGARIQAQITPFTHMAEARARANAGGLSAAVINAANSEVSHLVGVDVLATVPADLLDELSVSSADGRVYAAFISAASAWMVENGGYQAGLAALAQMFLDGQFTQAPSSRHWPATCGKRRTPSSPMRRRRRRWPTQWPCSMRPMWAARATAAVSTTRSLPVRRRRPWRSRHL